MKILFLVNRNSHGGSIKMTAWLANQLVNYHDVFYYNASANGCFYSLDKRIKYVEDNCNKSEHFFYRNTLSVINCAHRIIKLHKKEKFDLVINFSDHALYPLVLVKALTGIKVLVSQRVDPYSCNKKSDKIRLKLYKYCDGLVCQTASALEYFSDAVIHATSAIVIENPAIRKAKKYWSSDEKHDYIICLGRLDIPQKRQDVLINAFKLVHEKYPDIELHLYGQSYNDGESKINKLIQDLNLENVVFYKGITSKSLDLMQKAAMLVLSSDYEGIPNVILEGMDVGLPIVSTDCRPGGARLLIDSDDKGLIVPCGDVNKLAEAMIYMLEHTNCASSMALKAQQALERFSERNIIIKWLDYINNVANKN